MSQIPIYTIGYGTREINEFIALLQAHNIAYLIDVRSQPYSRHKPDFSQKALAQHVQAAGLRYVFMGDMLGGKPDDADCYVDGQVDYARLAQKPFYAQGIGRLQEAHRQQQRVALLCAEGKPEMCHRTHLIGNSLTAVHIPVLHIDEKGELVTQAAVLQRLQNAQMELWEMEAVPPPPPDYGDDFPFYDDYASFDETDTDAYLPDDNPLPPLPVSPTQTTPVTLNLPTAQKLLKQVFGYDDFRPLQADIIQSILDKQDALAIMPTGSGKSLCFQLPALMFPGLTVVVSPLISLMEDQVMQLRELGVTAVYLNSTLSPQAQYQITTQIRAGQVKLLYAAPETLMRPDTLRLLEQTPVDCLTIDEAHCISEWGHDFRPEYRQLTELRRRLPQAVCLALTATATERVRQDILANLSIPDAQEFIASFDRENLYLAVAAKSDGLAQTLAFLDEHRDEAGIIYCATRRQVDVLTEQLTMRGWSALPYHAGLDDATRRHNQQQFIRDDAPIMVATIAFGMGINKSNVRFIVHYDLPKNLESYYQQIGRAGRDGLRADCLLLYSYADVQTIHYFIQQQDAAQQRGARLRLDGMLGFVETAVCRRRPLLAYFGETYNQDNCDLCDNCTTQVQALVDVTIPAQKFLSCVKRTGERFGTSHVIDVLRGSQAQKVLKFGHDQLSTYNIGGEFSKKEWQHLARQFIQQELLVQDMEHGSLHLTPKAYAVFKGEQVMGTLPEQPRPLATPVQPHDAALFALLRARRKELADAVNLPPYAIFSDKTLVEMATYFPQSTAAFANLYGVGAAKLDKYADLFLPVMRTYCTEHGLAERAKPGTALSQQRPVSSGGRMVEVAELFNNGRSIPDIADLYNVKQSTIINHLWNAIQAGHTIQADSLRDLSQLSPSEQQHVLDAFAELGTDRLRPVYDALGEQVSYDELHLLRLYFATRG
ncbi:MAG: DNA helicase RecQ [Ardenticatenaceae bacterium]|nr:DNA helicase RecQ [Ardenticatenaceae bacterium]